ncbi:MULTISPECIES: protein kinase domain-containing protein [Streptomyces]|uniref:protein kinase domain-containing protein n=1 Tax=Streptomyces herbicida TaxID=3065675 RepID=UPI002931CD51|nr:hypothetical protein [Streptomyces sp. NEAU-HV9]
MVVTRPWRLPRWTEVRELHTGRCGRVVLAWPAHESGDDGGASAGSPAVTRAPGAGHGPARPAVVRYVPALPLIHRPREAAFLADVRRLAGLRVPEAAVPYRFVAAPAFRTAYERSAVAVGGALISDAVEGVTLARLLDRHAALSGPAAAVLFRGVLRALAGAHERGTAHGDLRPGKVLVGADGTVTVTGLGLAALTTGAPELRAPELWRGTGEATHQADVYAAACVLYRCLTGGPPFPVPQLFSLMARHTTAPVPLAAIPRPLRALLAAGLTKDPELRPRAASLLAEMQRPTSGDWEETGRSELGALAAPMVEPLPRTPPRTPPASQPPLWPVGPARPAAVLGSPSRRKASYVKELG